MHCILRPMAWLLLIVAGLFEVAWAVGLKYTDGFARPLASLLVALALAVSMLLLSIAVQTLPIGTAYAVWVGIGAVGAALCGVWLFGEPLTLPRAFFLCLLLAAIAGLRLTTPAAGS